MSLLIYAARLLYAFALCGTTGPAGSRRRSEADIEAGLSKAPELRDDDVPGTSNGKTGGAAVTTAAQSTKALLLLQAAAAVTNRPVNRQRQTRGHRGAWQV